MLNQIAATGHWHAPGDSLATSLSGDSRGETSLR